MASAGIGSPVRVASYRLQLTPDVRFAEAIGLVDHLASLGVSHVYLAPVAEALPGSTHGYDVVDHTTVRAELGGDDGLAALLAAAADRGLGVIVDHVPNHVSTARPDLNRQWWTTLRDGSSSPAAAWFDVDWDAGNGRVLLPLLDAPLDEVLAAGRLSAAEDELVLDGVLRLPLAAGTADLPLAELLDRQHYRLEWWRTAERNVRRFFTVDDLVAVRVEDPEVAAEVDRLPAAWSQRAGFAGVRVDHVDGLADPAAYLARLRAKVGDGAWLLVEKILAPRESMPVSWPVDGSTGYDAMRLIDHVLIDGAAAGPFSRLWQELTGDRRAYPALDAEARREVLAGELRPDLDRTIAAAERVVGSLEHLDDAVTELTVHLPRYRTYLPHDPDGAAVLAATAQLASRAAPAAAGAIERIVAALLDPEATDCELRTRWQQLTAAATAKGGEDRAFYRFHRVASLCEVGGDPSSFGCTVEEFHREMEAAQREGRCSLVAGSTHDTKRSEDVRARSAALTSIPDEWAAAVRAWNTELSATLPALDGAMAVLALQTVVTCPGLDRTRLTAHLVKAAREAAVRTSWRDPDAEYERLLDELAALLLGNSSVAHDVHRWSPRLDAPAAARSLAGLVLRLTLPGVPDIYQGNEGFTYRLVDPDNRVTPDWDGLRALVALAATLDGPTAWREHRHASKTVVIGRTLALRRRRPASFALESGSYRALPVVGSAAARVVALVRGDDVVTLAGLDLFAAEPLERSALALPAGAWRNVLDDSAPEVSGTVPLDTLLGRFPVAVLERARSRQR